MSRTGGATADRKVENALLKKAVGFTADVVKTYKLKRIEYQDGKKTCEREELAQGVDQVFVPPDLSAQIFWLKNRKPAEWKEKVVGSEGPNPGAVLDNLLKEFQDDIHQETD